jgi:hypothetical protein
MGFFNVIGVDITLADEAMDADDSAIDTAVK